MTLMDVDQFWIHETFHLNPSGLIPCKPPLSIFNQIFRKHEYSKMSRFFYSPWTTKVNWYIATFTSISMQYFVLSGYCTVSCEHAKIRLHPHVLNVLGMQMRSRLGITNKTCVLQISACGIWHMANLHMQMRSHLHTQNIQYMGV